MFYFYGRKHRIANKYPKPIYHTIIEPFSGSAAYSMLYSDKNVILNDIDDKVYHTWEYLINSNTEDIKNLPILKKGQSLDDKDFDDLTKEQKYLIGYFLNPGSAVPKKSPGNYCAWNEKNKNILINNIEKVRHWKIYNKSYEELDNIEATWFIDPPYQRQGRWYRHGNKNIDYKSLASWCLSRKGQIIVCENMDADWLPFEKLVNLRGQKNSNVEAIFSRDMHHANDS